MKPSVMNVLSLIKGDQRFVFIYDNEGIDTLLCELGKAASDEELDFTWYDAAVLSQRAKACINGK